MRNAHDVAESPAAAPVGHVHVAGNHVTEGAFHSALGVVVGEGGERLELLGAELYAHGVLLPDAEAQGFGEPVCVLAFQSPLEPFVVEGLTGHGLERIAVLIVAFTPLNVQFLEGIAEIVAGEVRSLDGEAAVVGDAALVVGQGLRLYDYDAVGALRTVDGLGGGVFEDGYALDAVHVHVGHLFQGGLEAVEDEERLVGLGEEVALEAGSLGGKRGRSADLHGGHRIGVGARLQVVQNEQRRVEVL